MINENDLLEPRKAYEEILKEEHKANALKYFEELASSVDLDVSANMETMRQYRELKEQEANASKMLAKKRKASSLLVTFGIISIVIGVICSFIGFNYGDWMLPVLGIVAPIILIGLAIFLFIINGVKIRPVVKNQSNVIKVLQSSQKEMVSLGYQQMKPLNDAFTWNMHVDIANQTTPLIKLDRVFENSRLQYLKDYFGYKELNSKDISVVHVQSGEIIGNPFVILTMKVMNMGTCTYTGTKTITYTVRVPNGGKNGGYHSETRTQTLTATITKPKPYYNYEKQLYYGCDAAPELSFSRSPSGMKGLSADGKKKLTKKIEKELAKLSEKEMGKSFQALGNTEFEALFHAWDRDNEIQYRLLFTPLAQRNYLDLIKNDSPYGDDFSIVKNKKINKVITQHSQYTDYVCSPDQFKDFSFENARNKFVQYNEQYFKSFFFDMAALISMPLYQQYPTDDYIFRNTVGLPNNTLYETEAIANSYDENVFKPLKCRTEQILKAKILKTDGDADRVNITSYGFETIEHVDYVPVYGKDGHWHEVAVHWVEYLPVHGDKLIEVLHHQVSKKELNEITKTDEFDTFVSNNTLNRTIVYNKDFYSFLVPSPNSEYTNESFKILRSNKGE